MNTISKTLSTSLLLIIMSNHNAIALPDVSTGTVSITPDLVTQIEQQGGKVVINGGDINIDVPQGFNIPPDYSIHASGNISINTLGSNPFNRNNLSSAGGPVIIIINDSQPIQSLPISNSLPISMGEITIESVSVISVASPNAVIPKSDKIGQSQFRDIQVNVDPASLSNLSPAAGGNVTSQGNSEDPNAFANSYLHSIGLN